jgi:hypothetical protein
VLCAVVAVTAVAGFIVWRTYRDTSTQVAIDTIIDEFRARPLEATGSTAPTVRLPEPGVYVYSTTGSESVDALGGASHDYPSETTITVVRTGCGVVLRWVALAERSEEWDLCPGGDGGLESSYYESYHRFFGQDDRRRYECGVSTILPAGVAAGDRWARSCSSGDRTEVTSTQVVGTEAMTIGGRTVDAVHLRLAAELSAEDGTSGTTQTEVWLDGATGLPLRHVLQGTTTSPQVIGDVHFQERYELVLTSLDPRR